MRRALIALALLAGCTDLTAPAPSASLSGPQEVVGTWATVHGVRMLTCTAQLTVAGDGWTGGEVVLTLRWPIEGGGEARAYPTFPLTAERAQRIVAAGSYTTSVDRPHSVALRLDHAAGSVRHTWECIAPPN